ncbi:MAG TPA: hypothetical protein VI357_01390 [Mycobacteriales bacterium]
MTTQDHGSIRQYHTGTMPARADLGGGTSSVEEGRTENRIPEPAARTVVPEGRTAVRWGPIAAGVAVTLAVFLLVQLVFFALGWLTLDPGADDPDRSGLPSSVYLMTGLAGAIAFLAGGAVAGASAARKAARTGLLQGALLWAVVVSSILLLTLIGGGQLFGAFSGALQDLSVIQNSIRAGDLAPSSAAVQDARDVAGWAILALVAFLTTSSAGGLLGAAAARRAGQESSGR